MRFLDGARFISCSRGPKPADPKSYGRNGIPIWDVSGRQLDFFLEQGLRLRGVEIAPETGWVAICHDQGVQVRSRWTLGEQAR